MWKDIITLRTEIIGQDADGYPTTTYEDTEVWANKKALHGPNFMPLMLAE